MRLYYNQYFHTKGARNTPRRIKYCDHTLEFVLSTIIYTWIYSFFLTPSVFANNGNMRSTATTQLFYTVRLAP